MEDLSVIHDKKAPPSPWLLASYRYATRRFNADAIVHVGTHGLVEWRAAKSGARRPATIPSSSSTACRTRTSSTCSIRSRPRSRGAARTRRSSRTSARRSSRSRAPKICATCTGSCTTTTTRFERSGEAADLPAEIGKSSTDGLRIDAPAGARRKRFVARCTTSSSRSKASSRRPDSTSTAEICPRKTGSHVPGMPRILRHRSLSLVATATVSTTISSSASRKRALRTARTITTSWTSCAKPDARFIRSAASAAASAGAPNGDARHPAVAPDRRSHAG